MVLKDLLADIYTGEVEERFFKTKIFSISCDSRKVMKGELFVALQGISKNGADFIEAAIAKGACAVATGQDIASLKKKHADVCFLKVDDPQNFLEQITFGYFGNPSEEVRTIGVTGTNGKTTIAYLVEAIFKQADKECGVIGTINYRLGDNMAPAGQTTPSFLDNQLFLTSLASQNVPYCVIEVSSHALTQGRVNGIDFKEAVFTNLTNDHLDYHGTMEEYFKAKLSLFAGLPPESAAIINTDDGYGCRLLTMIKSRIMSYGVNNKADVMAKNIQLDISGSHFHLSCPAGTVEMRTALIGMYNIYNVLAAAAVCLSENISLEVIKKGVESLNLVPGRLQRVKAGQEFSVFIDYAHTPDALENVLSAIRRVSLSRIILVFGCGGDRDQSKRILMGEIADRLADFSIVTSDNPRSESPEAIIGQIVPGFHKGHYKAVVDRQEAIAEALKMAQPGDTVLIAGKGHEIYQIFAKGPIPFNEQEIIEKLLKC